MTQPPPVPRAKRRAPIAIIVLSVIIVVAVCVGGVALIGSIGDDKPISGNSGKPIITSTAPNSPAPGQNDYHTPVPADFKPTVKILTKECFGSAGCNITFRVTLAKVGTFALDPTLEYELTYEVRGGEEVQVNTMTITGDEYSDDDQQFVFTKSSKAKLVAVITSVELH